MNVAILIGRLTRDPEVKALPSGINVCNFTIAVDRSYKSKDGTRQADFISCTAWKERADLLGKYFFKGSKIAIEGNIQTRSWEQDGVKRYSTEVVVDQIHFVESKKDSEGRAQEDYLEEDDTALPFDF